MSPVSEISPCLLSFVKFSTCSYERTGWLSSRHLGFCNRDVCKRAENFIAILASVSALVRQESWDESSNYFAINRVETLATQAKNFTLQTLQPSYADESVMNSVDPDGIVLHFLRYFSHHKECTVPQVICQSYDRRESCNVCISPCLLCLFRDRTRPQDPQWPFFISKTGRKFLI